MTGDDALDLDASPSLDEDRHLVAIVERAIEPADGFDPLRVQVEPKVSGPLHRALDEATLLGAQVTSDTEQNQLGAHVDAAGDGPLEIQVRLRAYHVHMPGRGLDHGPARWKT